MTKKMSKKDYIKTVLETVKDVREPAKAFLALIEQWMFQTQEAIDWLVTFLTMSIKEALKTGEQQKLKDSLLKLQKLQNESNKGDSDSILDNI